MRRCFFLFLLVPIISVAQIEKSLQLKIGMLKNFSEKGEKGEELFWQTKGKITFSIVNYTDAQNHHFKDLFTKQYREIMPVFNQMAKTQDENASTVFFKMVVRHEEEYRNLLTPAQLEFYRAKLTELETKNPQLSDSYSALYFSDKLLNEYRAKLLFKQ